MNPLSSVTEIRPSPALRLTLLIIAYSSINFIHTRKIFPNYGKRSILIPHIVASVIEIFRFAYLDLWADPVPTSVIDVLLCLVQSVTNAILVWNLKIGIPVITRPTYLIAAIFRTIFTIAAYTFANPDLHRISIYELDAFIFARLFIWFQGKLGPGYNRKYAIAISASAITAAALSGWRIGGNGGQIALALGGGSCRGAMMSAGGYAVLTICLMGIRWCWQNRARR